MTPEYYMDGLIKRGLPPHIAKAFVWNFQDESGFDPSINEANPTVPGSRGGFGLYQVTGPRRRQYEQFADQRGAALGDPDAQMDFLMLELSTTEKSAWNKISAAQDTPTAAASIVTNFLRPAEQHRNSRVAKYMSGKDMTLSSRTPGHDAPPPPAPQRDPTRLAWAYANGKMTPEDEALYDQGMAAGVFPKAQRTAADVYRASVNRPRTPFQPVVINAEPIRAPFGRT